MLPIIIILFISLGLLPLGIPVWFSLGVLTSLAYFMAINQHPYLFYLVLIGGFLIDLISLQSWGMTSILLLIFIAMGYGVLFQFERSSSAIVVILSLALYMVRQIWTGQPVSWMGIIGISIVSGLISLILFRIATSETITVRKSFR